MTTFFRDPEAWEALREQVVAPLFEGNGPAVELRVWVPGCATGEEAYSLAILLLEEAQRRDVWPELQVFASDLDEGALATAREGRYPAAIEADVSEERLRRFFVAEGNHYRVDKQVRDCVLFATHSLLRDPPFTRLDLISCRNLLIYLDRDLQKQAFGICRYALGAGGYLFLGASESAEGPYFHPLDKKHHIFQVRTGAGTAPPHLPELLLSTPRVRTPAEYARTVPAPPPARAIHRALLEDLAPPSLVANRERHVVHLSESVGRYLQPRGGPLSHDADTLVRPELQAELRAALLRSFERGEPTLSPFIPVPFDGTSRRVAMLVQPRSGDQDEPLALVVFLDSGAATPEPGPAEDAGDEDVRRLLREELRQTRERLGTSREEFEAANEELRAANEELQSVNEEFRSTAEELETSTEELQSINEELETVNDELSRNLDEISRAHSDLENLMAATDIGTLFLDRGLRIRRFTPQLAELFNVTENDRGRPISDFTHRLDYPEFETDALGVLETLVPVEREIRTGDGRWFLSRLRPYRTDEDRIDGVVITFVDFTERKHTEEAFRQSEEKYRLLVEGVEEYAMLAMDPDRRLIAWNTGSEKVFGYSASEIIGQSADTIFTPEDRGAGVPGREMEIARSDGAAADDRWHLRRDGTRFWASGVMSALRTAEGDLRGYAKVLRDNTDRKQADEARELLAAEAAARAQAEQANQLKRDFLATMSHELRTPLNAVIGYSELLELGVPQPIPDASREHVRRIRLSTRHLLEVIEEMLAFSRIEVGREGVELQRVQVEPLLDEVVAMIEPLATRKGLDFNVSKPDGPQDWWTDARKLRQILLNLLGNAVKFTKQGDISLTVEQRDAHVLLIVRDTGIGIDPAHNSHLFEPFWQCDSSLTRAAEGTGLGLAIAQRFANLLDGGIEVDSSPGHGSTFTVTLPMLDPAKAEEAAL